MTSMTDGFLLIDKPAGMSSFGVVARIRRVLGHQASKKVKVGHTGTLDPFATGLMIIVVGTECKRADEYTKLDKVYEATIRLGQTSSTGDPEGEIVSRNDDIPDRERIDSVLERFRGEIRQRPPIYSAIKIDGRRAYKLARDGQLVEMPVRSVKVFELDAIDYSYPELKIRTHVSSGTYIRSLAVDIGEALGTGAYCEQLRRIRIANWNVKDAKQLGEFGITD